MYKLWAEWDIGQDGLIFAWEGAAWRWFNSNEHVKEIMEMEQINPANPFKFYHDEGLVNLEKLEIIY